MTVLITLTTAGADTGPFNLFSDADSYTTPFETAVSRAALLAGYTSSLVPTGTGVIRVASTGGCENFIDLDLLAPTTTTTTTIAPTTTTTTSSTTSSTTTTTTTTAASITAFATVQDDPINVGDWIITVDLSGTLSENIVVEVVFDEVDGVNTIVRSAFVTVTTGTAQGTTSIPDRPIDSIAENVTIVNINPNPAGGVTITF